MRGEPFAHDGKSGRWIYYIYEVRVIDMFSAAADIYFQGQLRCKLMVCVPQSQRSDGIKRLQQKCIRWIETAEIDRDSLTSA